MLDERRDIAGHQFRAERSIDIGGPAVALQIDTDDLPPLRERRKIGTEHLGRAEPAVQEDERPAGPVDLVVELDAVDVRDRHCRQTKRTRSDSVELLGHTPDRGGDLIAQWTKSGGACDMSLVRRLELGRKPVRPIERVLKVGAPHQPDALALVVKGGPVRLKLAIRNEVLEFDKTRG